MAICLFLLHWTVHCGSFGVNALLEEDSEHRLPLPSLFHSVCCVWAHRQCASPLKKPLDGYPIRLGSFPSSRIFFCPSHPQAITEEMKATNGEYEEMVWIDGWLVSQCLYSSFREVLYTLGYMPVDNKTIHSMHTVILLITYSHLPYNLS